MCVYVAASSYYFQGFLPSDNFSNRSINLLVAKINYVNVQHDCLSIIMYKIKRLAIDSQNSQKIYASKISPIP